MSRVAFVTHSVLVLTAATGTQRFYGYARTQTRQGIGFSTEGFPIENFNDQIQRHELDELRRTVQSVLRKVGSEGSTLIH